MITYNVNCPPEFSQDSKIGDNHITRLIGLELENEYKDLATWRHDMSDTVSNPVDMSNYTYEVRHKECITYLFDWGTFYGEKLTNFDDRNEKLMVDLFLRGGYFQNKNFSNQGQPLSVRKSDLYTETRPASGMKWSYRYDNQLGITLFIAKHPETGKIDTVKLELNGHGISNFFPRNNHLDFVAMIELIQMIEPKLQATRLDTTIEIPHSMLDILAIRDAIDSRNFSGVKDAFPFYGVNTKVGYKSMTLYFGSPSSQKRVRIYATGQKHGYHAIRIEVQNRGKYARFVASEAIRLYNEGLGFNKGNSASFNPTDKQKDQTAKVLNDFIRDYVLSPSTFNLVDRHSKKRWMSRDQFKELPFWTEFKRKLKVEAYTYHFEPVEVTIQKKVKNLLRNFSGIHRVLCETIGKPAVEKLTRYFDLIHYGKYGGGFNDKLSQAKAEIEALGQSWITDLFDHETRCLLRQVGFYNTPAPKPHYTGLQTVLEVRENNLSPPAHQLGIAF